MNVYELCCFSCSKIKVLLVKFEMLKMRDTLYVRVLQLYFLHYCVLTRNYLFKMFCKHYIIILYIAVFFL